MSRKQYIIQFIVVFSIAALLYALAYRAYYAGEAAGSNGYFHKKLGASLIVGPAFALVGVIIFFRDMRKYK
jgi:hypothetical protein